MKNFKDRFWEIDSLRGIAIISMIFLHFLYDLNFFKFYTININGFPLIFFSQPTRIIFLSLVGVSLSLSYSRVKNRLSDKDIILKYVRRGLLIFVCGILVTVFSWVFFSDSLILFGVLHCIGLSIILSVIFLKLRTLNLLLGVVFVSLGVFLRTLVFDFNWLLWLGFIPRGFRSADYFPILPWFGVILIGIFIGNVLYPDYRRVFKIQDISNLKIIKYLCILGRHSLIIYIVHQPVMLFVLYIVSLIV